jgi:hypothetical protein
MVLELVPRRRGTNSAVSGHQNAGYDHNLMTSNKSLENMAHLRYLGTTVTYQNMHSRKYYKQIKFGECFLMFSSVSCIPISYLIT